MPDNVTERLRARSAGAQPVTLEEVVARSRPPHAKAQRALVGVFVAALVMLFAIAVLAPHGASGPASEGQAPAPSVTTVPVPPAPQLGPVTTMALAGCPQTPDHPAVVYIRETEAAVGGHWQVFWVGPSCDLIVEEGKMTDGQKARVRELAQAPVQFWPPGQLPLAINPGFRG